MHIRINHLKGLFAFVLAAGMMHAQTAAPTSSGTVTKVDTGSKTLTLKTDAGQEMTVTLAPKTSFRRVAPGATDLTKAEPIEFNEIKNGDRVLARGKIDNQNVEATLIVVMSQGDIAKKNEAERADWDKRGVTGLVTAASADSITINTRTLAGAKPLVLKPAPSVIVRRYAPDSVSFQDAKLSTLPEIKVGDQVRARGDKNADGSEMSAVEIVSGSFKNMAGVILSINAAANELQVRDLETKKPVTIKLVADSSVKKIQPQLAQVIATRLHGEAAGARGDARGGGQGDFGRGAGDGRGRGGAGRGGNVDIQTMLDNSPSITIADLKSGDAVVVSSTVGATAGRFTAIKLLAGVEPILTKPGTQEMSLGSWDFGGALGGGGQ
jgi:transcription antitermination factor NusG